MRTLGVVVAAVIGMLALAVPALAWDNGTGLRTGDVICTDQVRADGGARFHGHVRAGTATVTIRVAATAGGPETVAWSGTGVTGDFNRYEYGAAGTHYRGCITVTAHGAYTWARSSIMGLGAGAVGDLGPHTATLSAGAHACGDWGLGDVHLTGSAGAPVTWYVTAFDQDYGFVGPVLSIGGATLDTGYSPPPDLSLLSLCVHNTSGGTVSVAYEMTVV
ncbi:MAG TPA: hypothetical protein VGD67_17095 [Pseudonocardiaceae bacterium]